MQNITIIVYGLHRKLIKIFAVSFVDNKMKSEWVTERKKEKKGKRKDRERVTVCRKI